MSERARDLAPYEPKMDGRWYDLRTGELMDFDLKGRTVQVYRWPDDITLPTEDEPQPWHRSPAPKAPEQWRLTGRPFSPFQRAPSNGEKRHGAADRLLWAVSGVLGALASLWMVWSVFFG